MSPVLTQDWTDDDCAAEVAMCDSLGIDDVTVPLQVWANESDNKAGAHNPHGDASGIFQLMPRTARGLGWDVDADPHLDAYRAAGIGTQIQYAAKYYAPHKGHVDTVGRWYLCTFLPALLDCGSDLAAVLVSRDGTTPPPAVALLSPRQSSQYYASNAGFDHDHKGWITVGDLVSAAARATGPRTRELMARVVAAKAALAPTDPPGS